jgi:hypothetical protein
MPPTFRRRKEEPEWAGVTGHGDDRPVDPGRVEDGSDVVHAHLEWRRPLHSVGEARPALVEGDHAGEPSQPLEPGPAVRLLPRQLEVLGKARRPDERNLTVAEYLVGDVDLAASCEARFRHLHLPG